MPIFPHACIKLPIATYTLAKRGGYWCCIAPLWSGSPAALSRRVADWHELQQRILVPADVPAIVHARVELGGIRRERLRDGGRAPRVGRAWVAEAYLRFLCFALEVMRSGSVCKLIKFLRLPLVFA